MILPNIEIVMSSLKQLVGNPNRHRCRHNSCLIPVSGGGADSMSIISSPDEIPHHVQVKGKFMERKTQHLKKLGCLFEDAGWNPACNFGAGMKVFSDGRDLRVLLKSTVSVALRKKELLLSKTTSITMFLPGSACRRRDKAAG